MGKESLSKDSQKSKDAMGRLYKQFSNQKYEKYRQQFPRMRESDVIAKIIKEWEAMSEDQRRKLEKVRAKPESNSKSKKK